MQPGLETTLDLAKVRILQGNGDAALAVLQPAAEREAANLEVQFFLGEAYRVAGQPAHAREAYEAALRIDPRFSPARAALEALPR
ncbi:MAG: tetratricopeptide repeat protein [Planctomycetaceae bacterium]|nr:tetratricopeptide repeat protein [Planctomycetaceae bacterium]